MTRTISVFTILAFVSLIVVSTFPLALHATSDTDPTLALIINLLIPGVGHLLAGEVGSCIMTAIIFDIIYLSGYIVDMVIMAMTGTYWGICTTLSCCLAYIYLIGDSVKLKNKLEEAQKPKTEK